MLPVPDANVSGHLVYQNTQTEKAIKLVVVCCKSWVRRTGFPRTGYKFSGQEKEVLFCSLIFGLVAKEVQAVKDVQRKWEAVPALRTKVKKDFEIQQFQELLGYHREIIRTSTEFRGLHYFIISLLSLDHLLGFLIFGMLEA